MNKLHSEKEIDTRRLRFSLSLFGVYFLILLLMSGLHTGLVVFVSDFGFSGTIQTTVLLVYWALVALGLTVFTGQRVKNTYEIPMKNLAEATNKVAHGDFSVFVPSTHIMENRDYLDRMIKDFNKMVEELGSIETLKTDFFSNVSHEIKMPIAIIQSNAELLLAKCLSHEQQRECTETILQSTKRLSNLITNMLKLNKLEKQAIQPIPQVYNLCDQLCECAIQFENIWEQKNIEFVADIEERTWIEADRELLELVWNNLLSNALKFTADNGTITLRQTSNGKKACIIIADTGCGMEQKTLERIFEKFYQGDTSHSTEGNGLGLALVKRILELSDGTIYVESTPGQGSVFTVELPISPKQIK